MAKSIKIKAATITAEQKEEIKKENQKNLYEVGGVRSVVNYFSCNENIEGKLSPLNLVSPFRFGNDNPRKVIGDFTHRISKELEINNAVIPFTFWDQLFGTIRSEIKEDEFIELLNFKFDEVKVFAGYETKSVFAKDELLKFTEKYNEEYFSKLPIVKQWTNFLKDVSEGIEPSTSLKDKLTNKQQILILKELGFFDLPKLSGVNGAKMGILLSYLLNRDAKQCEVAANLRNGKNNALDTPTNKKKIKEVLVQVRGY